MTTPHLQSHISLRLFPLLTFIIISYFYMPFYYQPTCKVTFPSGFFRSSLGSVTRWYMENLGSCLPSKNDILYIIYNIYNIFRDIVDILNIFISFLAAASSAQLLILYIFSIFSIWRAWSTRTRGSALLTCSQQRP